MTRKHHRYVRLALSCAVAAGAAPGVAAAADESIIGVTTTLDSLDAFDQRCSLREALKNANTNTAFSPVTAECASGSNSKTDVIVLKTTSEDY